MLKNTFLLAIAVGILFATNAGCKKTDTTSPASTKLRPISDLEAYSKSSTEVGLGWIASPDVANGGEHHITVKLGSTTVTTVSIPIGQTSTFISGLTEGLIYTFSIVVDGHSSDYTDSDPVTIRWSPARRITTDLTLPTIKVYETTSSSFPSGLIFFNVSTNSSKTVSIASPGTDSLLIDVYARTEASSAVSLRSAHLFSSTWRITRFSSVSRNVSSLDDPVSQPPDTTTYASSNTSITIDSSAITTSRVYYFKGNNGNYGRILIKRQSNGTLIGGTSPDQFLDVQISYQTVSYNPYSKTARK